MPGMFEQSKETGKGSSEREKSDDKFGDGGGGRGEEWGRGRKRDM